MTYSLNEIEGLSKRAARGAGRSWGMAEEAAKAVRWLSSFNLQGAEGLHALLTAQQGRPTSDLAPHTLDGIWVAPNGNLCPLSCGAALCDVADRFDRKEDIVMTQVGYPTLILPFMASLNLPFCVTWGDVVVTGKNGALHITAPQSRLMCALAEQVTCTALGDTPDKLIALSKRANVTTAAWDGLTALALRTYAPATESSRILGAGAGNSDND